MRGLRQLLHERMRAEEAGGEGEQPRARQVRSWALLPSIKQ
jgi:hypothetical protein